VLSGLERGVTAPRASVAASQDAGASGAGIGLAGVTASAGTPLAVAFFLLVAFLTDFFATVRGFGLAVALAELAAPARLAALFALAQRAF
jgi:hypothetical protein